MSLSIKKINMEEINMKFKPSRLQKANALLTITFGWCIHIFGIGEKEILTSEHLDNVPTDATSEFLVEKLESEWERQRWKSAIGGASLRSAIFRVFFPRILVFNILGFVMETIKLLQPILFGMFVNLFVEDLTLTTGIGLLYAALLATSNMIPDAIREPLIFYNRFFGKKVQTACCSLIYKKFMKFSIATIPKNSAMIFNEAEKFDKISTVFPYLLIGPYACILAFIILVYYVDMYFRYVVLGTFIVIVIFLPLQMLQRKMHNIYRERAASITRYRLSVLTEVFTSMRIVKMTVSERSFSEIVKKIRRSELSAVLLSAIFHFIAMVITFFGHRLLEVVFLTLYFVNAKQYVISDVFVIFTLMYILRPTILEYFPKAVHLYNECLMGCDKIEEFLLLKDRYHASTDIRYIYSVDSFEEPRIIVNELYCTWENSEIHALQNLSIDVCSGEILGVVGASGSGKSSFLLSLLHEIPITSGYIKVNGSIAYVSQQPCIFPGTIRQNILFGKQYNEHRYLKVVEAVALTKDFKVLPEKDLSVTSTTRLTVDQEVRINLARALYQDADIYLLDDPFRHMDKTLSRYIFDSCIMEYLKRKTRIITCSRSSFMREVDKILVLKQGKLDAIGGYYDVRIIQSFISSFSNNEEETPQSDYGSELEETNFTHMERQSRKINQIQVDENTSLINQNAIKSEEENMICWKHYADYLYGGTNDGGLALLIVCILITQVSYVFADFWISHWANLEQCYRDHFNDTTCTEERFLDPYSFVELDNTDSTIVFIIFIGVSSFLTVLYGLLFFLITLHACKRLHDIVFDRVIQTPLLFFKNTPLDRILCRFIGDMSTMEDELPKTMLTSIQVTIFTCTIIVVNIVMSWYLLFVAVPLLGLVWYARNSTLKTTNDIKRLEKSLKLPVDELISRTVTGLTTIRSHQAEENFVESFYNVQDNLNEAWIINQATERLLAVVIYCIVQVLLVSIILGSIIGRDGLNVGLVGMVVGRALLLCQLIQISIFSINDTENLMASVRRVTDYKQLYSESPHSIKSTKPPSSWPEEGNITFNNVYLSYSAESPIVLKNVSFRIHHREKIGILGRKDAGKSSIATALFRLAEPTGNIFVDGINISTIGLHDLRKKISIVPKDPVLFSTSLRSNLDPFGNFNDVSLWEALKRVRLDWYIRECTGKLDMTVGRGGNIFSVGQRQLIYLARAILQRNNILVVEEPVNDDDQIITTLLQHTLRNNFKHCTVLTITRRLHNIMDSDRIMIVDDGELVEFDKPYTLLQNRDSLVRHLLKELNTFERKRLLGIATSHYTDTTRK